MFDGQHFCKECGAVMVRASMYDPDGTEALVGGERDKNSAPLWVCTNPSCKEGKQNISNISGDVVEAYIV